MVPEAFETVWTRCVSFYQFEIPKLDKRELNLSEQFLIAEFKKYFFTFLYYSELRIFQKLIISAGSLMRRFKTLGWEAYPG